MPQASHSPGQGWIWRCRKRPKESKMVIDTHACALSSFPSCLHLNKRSQQIASIKLLQQTRHVQPMLQPAPGPAPSWRWLFTTKQPHPATGVHSLLSNNQTTVHNWHYLGWNQHIGRTQCSLNSSHDKYFDILAKHSFVDSKTFAALLSFFIREQSSILEKKKASFFVNFQFYFQLTKMNHLWIFKLNA